MSKKLIALSTAIILLIGISYFAIQMLRYVETDNAEVYAQTLMLSSKLSGFIQKIHIAEGDFVKKDQVLVEIEESDYKTKYLKAKAELASLEYRVIEAKKNFDRTTSLFKVESISAQEFEKTKATFGEIQAKYEAQKASVSEAEINLANTKILAPSDGYIAKKSAEVGQFAGPGAPLIGFVDGKSREILANIKETDVSKIKAGSPTKISIDAIPDKEFAGEVTSVSSATGSTFTLLPPDNSTGNFTKVVQRVPVHIKFSHLDASDFEQLRAGLSATVKIKVK